MSIRLLIDVDGTCCARGRQIPGAADAVSELQAMGGAVDLVRGLTVACCVASSSTHERLRFTLGKTGLYDLLAPHIFSAEDVQHGKPAPDLFLHAARTMRVRAKHCLVVEDSPSGIGAARAAAMTAIGFTGGSHSLPDHAERLRTAGAHDVIDELRQLPGIIAEVGGVAS